MADNQDIFGAAEVKETKDSANLTTAGVHRNLTFIEGSIKVIESKKGGTFTVTSLVFQTPEGVKFESNCFRPPASPDDCKPYAKDEWKEGKKTGNKIPVSSQQVFKERNQSYFYHLAQLGMALSGKSWADVTNGFKNHTSSYEALTEAFLKIYVPNAKTNRPVDIKLLWDNNDTNKTSFLSLAKAGEYQRVFASFEAGKPSMLSVSDREAANNMIRKHQPPVVDESTPTVNGSNAETFTATTPELADIGDMF